MNNSYFLYFSTLSDFFFSNNWFCSSGEKYLRSLSSIRIGTVSIDFLISPNLSASSRHFKTFRGESWKMSRFELEKQNYLLKISVRETKRILDISLKINPIQWCFVYIVLSFSSITGVVNIILKSFIFWKTEKRFEMPTSKKQQSTSDSNITL